MNYSINHRPGKINAAVGIVVAVALIAIVAVGLVFMKGSGYSGLQSFPADSYQNAPQNLLGNTYQMDAQVDSMLSYEPGVGRLLAVRMDTAPGRLPVFLPEGLTDSVHTGQRYSMRVNIRNGGLIYVEELKKY